MAYTLVAFVGYIGIDVDSNILDEKGIFHLSKSFWPQLRVFVFDSTCDVK